LFHQNVKRRHAVLLTFAAGIFANAVPLSAAAVEYRLVEGQEYAVCRAYEENLNRFSNLPPMACERRLDPALKDFSQPEWEVLDPKAHMDAFQEMIKMRSKERKESYDIEKAWPGFLETLENGEVRLERTEANIDNDWEFGGNKTVYRFAERACDPLSEFDRRNPSTWQYYVVYEPRTGYDYRHQKGRFDWKYQGLSASRGGRNLFFYKGEAYFDHYDHRSVYHPGIDYDARLHVIKPRGKGTHCQFHVYYGDEYRLNPEEDWEGGEQP
jgi:hypothetical protein